MGRDKKPDFVPLRAERRKSLRSQMLVLRINHADKNRFFGYATTLGGGGMFVPTINPRKVDEEFDISFNLPSEGSEITCRCRVVWVKEYDPESHHEAGMGIKFLEIDPEIQAKIEQWIKGG